MCIRDSHYHAPCSRTVFVGSPPKQMQEFAALCYEAMDAMMAIATPGHTCEELYFRFNSVLATKGFAKLSRVGYSFGVGYGPDWGEKTFSLRPGDSTVLEAGMCIHMIAGCGDAWSFQTSETVIITDGEPERLQGTARKLFVKETNQCKAEALQVEIGNELVRALSCPLGLYDVTAMNMVAAVTTQSSSVMPSPC
eukprot:TRINITY_DN3246_c0_g2_i1.p1 TRINITY_DN3246_c0_g2~~TRINITY_DN3246_c0_g2_i1.p1  ORF type:complete len:195 (+),score=38.54 TRINITY_DN3246_c0_g2_i1:77-661(+)